MTLPCYVGKLLTDAGSCMIRLTFPPLPKIISIYGSGCATVRRG